MDNISCFYSYSYDVPFNTGTSFYKISWIHSNVETELPLYGAEKKAI